MPAQRAMLQAQCVTATSRSSRTLPSAWVAARHRTTGRQSARPD
ncbi:hypothetical protein PXO_05728 [Xanthomonas oryzae pv. oryzae PXO99A]|uniref:Uncharacterized protein n=1 Tax=Xanthomonas oryzae pv. oryzae (strain PXO99A) TaxID=360094 RepID=A0A0K0GP09_XANOP|nr:hypothetical protein PXO_05728 [Xanthomonas oryzae pv. oryzae PXO99A]